MNPGITRCAISDRNGWAPESWNALLRQAARLAGEGIDFFQIREKDLRAGELAALTRAVLKAVHGFPARVVVNGRADVAVATAAHGVHLTSSADELTPVQVRRLYARAGLPSPVLTVSCHTLAEVERRAAEGVDAILFGPVFEKVVAGERLRDGAGLTMLREACATAGNTPVLALGGVTPGNVDQCLQAGARGVAGIRLFR